MIKKAYVVQMSYDITTEEKEIAEKALISFDHALKTLRIAETHLDIMLTPFKKNPEIDSKEVMKIRLSLRKFRDKSIENFNNFKKTALSCVKNMQVFGTDTHTIKLMKGFISSIDELETDVNKFVELFDNLQDDQFATNAVKAIEEIKKKCDSLQENIEERIKKHIQSDILANSWVDNLSNELQINIEKKKPLLVELYEENNKKK